LPARHGGMRHRAAGRRRRVVQCVAGSG
jgi:hypothetical protein